MASAKDSLAASNEAALELVTTMQQQILDATKSYVSAISDTTPDKLGFTTPDPADQPDPKDLIEETFRFQSRLLEANKSFALSLTDAWGSLGQSSGKAAKS